MITKLSVSNFKSVRQLDIDCKKVNLFIGEPNTGKSNILEVLGLLSWSRDIGYDLSDFVRFQLLQNLFYDQLIDDDIRLLLSLSSDKTEWKLNIRFKDDKFEFHDLSIASPFATMDYGGRGSRGTNPKARDIKFFRFKNIAKYDDKEAGYLKPPNGSNLFSVVFSSKVLRDTMMEFFRKYGLKLVLKPQEKVFELQKQTDDLVFSFPYTLTSDCSGSA